MSACFIHRTDTRWEYSDEEQWKETTLNLELALVAGEDHLAYRVVGDLRVVVDSQNGLLLLQIQRQPKKRRVLDEEGGQVRYLEDLFDGPGRYLCILHNLVCLGQKGTYLPLRYQALVLPESDGWYSVKRDEG